MKTAFNLTLLVLLLSNLGEAQNVKTYKKDGKDITSTSSSSASSSVSISVTEDSGEHTSISINDSDDIYHFSAAFEDEKSSMVKTYLSDKLGDEYLMEKKNGQEWKKSENGDVFWKVKLTDNNLKIFLDKEFTSTNSYERIQKIGEELSHMISSLEQ